MNEIIVIASADALFCETVRTALDSQGLSCEILDSEESTRDFLKDNAVEIRVLVYDSDLLGTDFLHRVRNHKNFQLLPILVAAKQGDVTRVEDYIDLGASYFLSKPIEPQKFLEYLGRILESQERHKSHI